MSRIIEYEKVNEPDNHCSKSLKNAKRNEVLAARSQNKHFLHNRHVPVCTLSKPRLSRKTWAPLWLIFEPPHLHIFFIWSNLREVENQKQSIYFVYLNFILIRTFNKNHKLFLLFTLLDILLYFHMKEFSKTICTIIFALLTLKTPSIMLQFYVSWYML